MLKLIIGTNTQRETKIVSLNKTIKDLLLESEIGQAGVTIMLDGANVTASQINSTLAELGYKADDTAMLIASVKAENGR